MSFDVINQHTKYRGRAFNVRQDQIRLPDGKIHQIDIVEHLDAVTIIPQDQSGAVWFIRQYRHPAKETLLELPAGVLEVGEEPLEGAQRELREEIGMAASRLELIGGFYLAPGYSTEYMHIFLATGLYPAPLPGDETEFLSIEKIPTPEVRSLTASGDIKDAKTIGALFLASQYLSVLD